MPYINQLPLVSQVNPGDQFVVWTPNNGDSRRLPVSELFVYFQEHVNPPETGTTLLAPRNAGHWYASVTAEYEYI
jgi:hypothetical protein